MAETGVKARFYVDKKLMGKASEDAKRPVYEDRVYLELRIVGNRGDVVIHEAKEEHKQRFPEAWAAYQAGHETPHDGTPLTSWPRMTPAMVANLRGLNVFTIEELASLPDIALQKIGMDGMKLRADAQQYLENAMRTADFEAMDTLQAQNETMAAQLKALSEQLAAMQETKKPKKEKAEA